MCTDRLQQLLEMDVKRAWMLSSSYSWAELPGITRWPNPRLIHVLTVGKMKIEIEESALLSHPVLSMQVAQKGLFVVDLGALETELEEIGLSQKMDPEDHLETENLLVRVHLAQEGPIIKMAQVDLIIEAVQVDLSTEKVRVGLTKDPTGHTEVVLGLLQVLDHRTIVHQTEAVRGLRNIELIPVFDIILPIDTKAT